MDHKAEIRHQRGEAEQLDSTQAPSGLRQQSQVETREQTRLNDGEEAWCVSSGMNITKARSTHTSLIQSLTRS